MVDITSEVVIVGAGPTGLMLAAELRLAGVTVTVLEKQAEPTRESRALGFSARTIEEFAQRGLLPRFGEVGTIPVGHFGGLPLDYRIVPGGSYGARGIPQSATERILGECAVERGADVRRRHTVTGLEVGADGVVVSADTPTGPVRVAASYVVGCDGARSVVRKLAGIGFPGNEATLEMWLADVAGVPLRPRFSGERVPGGMVMVLPLGPQVCRVVVHERGAGTRGDGEPPSFNDVADAWKRLTGEDIQGGKPLWVSWFTDASRLAAHYRNDRVFLAGDAAHIHLPIGGQGMSAGIQDAVNLGWKLAAAVHGYAPDGLLDSYETERRPVAARVIANTLAQRTLYLSGEEMDPLREVFAELMSSESVQRHLVGMVTGLDIRYDVGGGEHPLLGRRLPDVPLNGPLPTTFGYLRHGRGVLFDLVDDPAVRDLAAGWGDRVDVVTAMVDPANSGGLAGAGAVLVRPDGYICWVGPDGTGGATLGDTLDRWFGAPRADN
jgi:bifunctional hydroxylase/dehydrase